MTRLSKDATESTQQSSLDASTEAKVPQSVPLARTDNTKTSTKRTKVLSKSIKQDEERDKVLADMLKATVTQLEKRGLIKRYKVLSDRSTIKEIRLVLSPDVWTTELQLKGYYDEHNKN